VIAYLDSSVFLRVVLGQPDQLREWKDVREAVASAVAEVECLRGQFGPASDHLQAAMQVASRHGLTPAHQQARWHTGHREGHQRGEPEVAERHCSWKRSLYNRPFHAPPPVAVGLRTVVERLRCGSTRLDRRRRD
jgi:hypothetical protein